MKLRTAALAVLASLALSTAARAQGGGQDALRAYCTGDYMRLCSQFGEGTPQLNQCFQSNMRNLTPGCRQAIGAYPQHGVRRGKAKRGKHRHHRGHRRHHHHHHR